MVNDVGGFLIRMVYFFKLFYCKCLQSVNKFCFLEDIEYFIVLFGIFFILFCLCLIYVDILYSIYLIMEFVIRVDNEEQDI